MELIFCLCWLAAHTPSRRPEDNESLGSTSEDDPLTPDDSPTIIGDAPCQVVPAGGRRLAWDV
jgi:hypothetical protein